MSCSHNGSMTFDRHEVIDSNLILHFHCGGCGVSGSMQVDTDDILWPEEEIDTSADPWLWWDTVKLVEDYVKVTLEDQEVTPEAYDEIRTEDQIRESCYNDEKFAESAWGSLDEDLTSWMGGTTAWRASVENFGWQRQSGTLRPFEAETGEGLLNKILPATDCTYRIWKSGDKEPKVLKIQNFHHDNCTGNEWYTVTATEGD
jgi:hypothetical protein